MPRVAFPGARPLSRRGGRALLWLGLGVAVAAAALVLALIGGATTGGLFRELDRVSTLVSRSAEQSGLSGPAATPDPVQTVTPELPATPEPVRPFPEAERQRVMLGAPVELAAPPPAGGAPGDDEGAEQTEAAGGAPGEEPLPEEPLPPPELLVTCGEATCAEGLVCCNESCGICAAPGEECDQRACGMPSVQASLSCGFNTCNVGQVCCNESCGICTAPGASCSPEPCPNPIQHPGTSQICGMQTCNVGLVCCNPSCGICAEPGEPCSHEVCD